MKIEEIIRNHINESVSPENRIFTDSAMSLGKYKGYQVQVKVTRDKEDFFDHDFCQKELTKLMKG